MMIINGTFMWRLALIEKKVNREIMYETCVTSKAKENLISKNSEKFEHFIS